MLLFPLFAAVGSDTVESTEAGVLYITSNRENYCLTPWMDILADHEHRLNFDEVALDITGFKPIRTNIGTLNFGVSDTIFWLRFSVGLSPDNIGEERRTRILDLQAAYPDRIQWSLHNRKGDQIAAGGTRKQHDAFAGLEITPTPQTYYLKVQSTTALLLYPHLLTWKAYLDRNKAEMIWFGLFAGIIIAVGMYNFYLYFQFRDSSYLWYVLHLVFVLLYFFGINGVAGTYFLPHKPEIVGMLDRSFLGLMIATIALITRSFLLSRTKTPVIDKVIFGLFLLGCLVSLINLFFQARPVVIFLIIVGMMVPSMMILAAWRAYKKGFKPALLFMIAWSFFIIGVVLFALTNSGAIPYTTPGFYGFQVGSALAAVLLSFSLGDRIRTLRRERDSLKKSMDQVNTIVNSVESGVFLVDRDTLVIKQVNQAAERMIGRPYEEIVGRHCRQFLTSVGNGVHQPPDLRMKEESREDILVNASGKKISILKSTKLIELDRHELIIQSFVDISDLKQAEKAVRRSEVKFRSLFESSRDAIVILDKYRFVDCNKAALEIFGCSTDTELINRQPAELSPPCQPSGVDSRTESIRHIEKALKEGSHFFEWIHKRVSGDEFPAEVMISAVEFEDRTILQCLVRDISQRKRMEEELKFMATTDPLTGADNRRSFLEKGNYELLRSRRYNNNFSFLMLDVDHFKAVNDTYGHHCGDMVLKKLVTLSIKNLRRTDLFGRLGGEEFAAILPETDARKATMVGERLCRTYSGITVESDKGPVRFTVSIGLSIYEKSDETLEQIMARADAALYTAKQTGRNRLVRG